MGDVLWKENWELARKHLEAWWKCQGPALCVSAPRERPIEDIPDPVVPEQITARWTDPVYRRSQAEFEMSRTYYGGEAFPYFDPQLGPGNLATFLGSRPDYADETVWFNPCISDPDTHPPLRFDPLNPQYVSQLAIIAEGVHHAAGRYLVGVPDLVENVDTLASLRGTEHLLTDLLDRPDFVSSVLGRINEIWLEVFNAMRDLVGDCWGGNTWTAFRIWGPGRTAKLQCDASAAFSPAMFSKFVVPALTEQCSRLDYALYHLDGTQCIRHLDALLAVPGLAAIQWTPQAGRPRAGSPEWYGLYKRILQAGKGVQAVDVLPGEVIPLMEEVGPKGLFIVTSAESEEQARALEKVVDTYR